MNGRTTAVVPPREDRLVLEVIGVSKGPLGATRLDRQPGSTYSRARQLPHVHVNYPPGRLPAGSGTLL